MFALSRQLLDTCNRLRQQGHDFPTIWREIIEPHPLVAGIPVQAMEDAQPVLDIRLRTGETLRFRRVEFVLI